MIKSINYGWLTRTDDASFVEIYLKISGYLYDSEVTEVEKSNDLLAKIASRVISETGNVMRVKRYIYRQDLTMLKLVSNKARKSILSSIVTQLRGKERYDKEMEAAQITSNWLRDIAPKLPHYPQNQLSRYIGIISDDLEHKEDIVNAVKALGMLTHFNDLIEENNNFRDLEHENTILYEQKNMPTSEKVKIRQDAYHALRLFVDTLVTSMNVEDDTKYDALHFWIRKTLKDAHVAYKLSRKRKSSKDIDGEANIAMYANGVDLAQHNCNCEPVGVEAVEEPVKVPEEG